MRIDFSIEQYHCRYIMIGFKGIISKTSISSQAFDAVVKKSEELRKSCELLVDFYIDIAKLEEMKANCNMKVMSESSNFQYTDPYNNNILKTLTKITDTQKQLQQLTKTASAEASTLLTNNFNEISTTLTKLQESIESYQEVEEVTYEQSKKYYKAHKNMLIAIELYKDSFSDVNLIYNLDEKIKRYENCEATYRAVEVLFKGMGEKSGELFQKKKQISGQYNRLLNEFEKTIKEIADKSINKAHQITRSICLTSKTTQQVIKTCEYASLKLQFHSVFADPFDNLKLAYFDQNQLIAKNKDLPIIVLYHDLLKQEYFHIFNNEIVGYLKLVEERMKVNRVENRKLFEIVTMYFKNMEKILNSGLKWLLVNFQKKRKLLADCFGNRLVTFLKALTSIFEFTVGLNEKLLASAVPLLETIQNNINEDARLSKHFSEEINTNVQRFLIRKDIKRGSQNKQEFIDMRLVRKEIGQKSQFIKHMVTGFQEKIDANLVKMMNNYHVLISALKNTTDQFQSICEEYLELYFGPEQLLKNLQKYNADFILTRNKNKESYNLLQINSVKNDLTQIIFDGQFSKVDDFKKLKKPYKGQNLDLSRLDSSFSPEEDSSMRFLSSLASKSENIGNLADNEEQVKNAQFLRKKITFKQNQKLLKTYSCALAEKIILQGKIFITTERICFHSKFNSSNIFFGKTFIQFPKVDIKKIDKRKMSMLLDNSISFTTLNGQIIFTSFFSRDEAYDLICHTFNFNINNEVYEYEQKQVQQLPQFLIDLEQNDDMKISSIEPRKQSIEKLLSNYEYSEAANIQFLEQGLNALKLFKLFYGNFEIVMNNRKYQSYLKFIKESINHKNLQIEQWNPPLALFLNKSNLKETAPIETKRKLTMTVPVNSSGVPFMPKTAQSSESQILYFFSKHKFVLESIIETWGAPYTDTFKVNLKTVVQSDDDGKCRVEMKYFINFIKNPMIKNVIEAKTKQQTINVSKLWLNSMRKYFQTLHQKSKPTKTKRTVQQVTTQLQNITQQLQTSKQQNQTLSITIQQLTQWQTKFKFIILALIVLNILTILLYI